MILTRQKITADFLTGKTLTVLYEIGRDCLLMILKVTFVCCAEDFRDIQKIITIEKVKKQVIYFKRVKLIFIYAGIKEQI